MPFGKSLAVYVIVMTLVVGFGVLVISRAKAAPSLQLTQNEREAIRIAQVDLFKASQALAQSPAWQAQQAAQAEINHVLATVFSVRKLDTSAYYLCDGPDPIQPACAGLNKGELAIRALPKPAAAPAK
jgi:hypothetical protein